MKSAKRMFMKEILSYVIKGFTSAKRRMIVLIIILLTAIIR